MAMKKARVLTALTIGGVIFQPNQVIEAEAGFIKSQGDSVDTSPAAVKYCLDNGAKVARIAGNEETQDGNPDDNPDGNPDDNPNE